MADAESAKALSGLLNGIAQREFHNKVEVTEELLNTELYPELSRDQFTALHDRMRGLLKSIATADMDHAQLEAFLTAQTRRGPVALVELELGTAGQDSQFVCLEFDEANLNQVLRKMADIQGSIDSIVQRS
uniref:COMM domain-containing protein 1 n=1 Tax=Mola mola TaxID=94237 RepID=A0A3Q3X1D4_MOLML